MNPTTDLIDHRSRTRTTSGARHGSGLTAELDREWCRLRHHPRTLRTLRAWIGHGTIRADGALADELHGLRDLDDLVAATQRPDHRPDHRPGGAHGDSGTTTLDHSQARRADEILLELVAVARREQLAGRIVLQRILPGLLARSRRYAEPRMGHELADVVVAAAWVAIHGYDHERRSRHVAASLVSDTVFAAFRQPHRRRSATEQLRPHESWTRRPATGSATTPIVELAELVAEAGRCGVERHHLDLIRHLARTGSAAAVASELGVTDRTVRTRRKHAVEQVREAVLAA